MTAAALDAKTNSEAMRGELAEILALSRAMEDQFRLLYAMLDEITADTDVRSAALHLSCQSAQLWKATQKIADAAGVHSLQDLSEGLEAGARMLEPWMVAIQTLAGTLPEVLEDLARSGVIQKLGAAGADWVRILERLAELLRGSASSVTHRVDLLTMDLERWVGELAVAWETLAATLPEVLQDEVLHQKLTELQHAIGVWASVAIEARAMVARCGGGNMASGARALVCSIRDGLDDVQKEGKKGGGVFALVRLFLSGKTVYVLRNVISIAYRVLKTMNEAGGKKNQRVDSTEEIHGRSFSRCPSYRRGTGRGFQVIIAIWNWRQRHLVCCALLYPASSSWICLLRRFTALICLFRNWCHDGNLF